ncbi:hypothetical protein DQ04_00241100 [Trypanosoma grayi]|uniref:hypothetical protein n=1 Tax=Trypanosoma grayi TaxID=71804 RepID=UPI0004F45801|nr:hypothetical protein DQ04_00241100 [Trypanosoma grayi]KEG14968.1 hypothetical protein DQ04_00241100 [Trypanosoma grayi]
MRQGKRFASPVSTLPPHQRPPAGMGRSRQRQLPETTAVGRGRGGLASPLGAPRSFSARSRTASNDTRQLGSAMGERRAMSRAASAGARQRNTAAVGTDARHVSFLQEQGNRLRGTFFCAATSPDNTSYCSSNPVRHLLSELVEISQTLASYLEDATAQPPPQQQQQQVTSPNGNPTRKEQVTLKAQEIERIVKRVEAHFVEKIASMEFKAKEQAKTIAELTREICCLRQQEEQPLSPSASSSRMAGQKISSLSDQQQQQKKKRAGSGHINNNGVGDEELENLRRALQEEKRQRLFVEEQTQSLTEQHGRVVSTLERRLQKQEEQLRELISSLDHQHQLASSSSSPPHSRSPSSSPHPPAVTTSPTPRRLLRQQLAQHEQTQLTLEAYRRSLRGSDVARSENLLIGGRAARDGDADVKDDDNGFFAGLGHVGPKPVLRGAAQKSPQPYFGSPPPPPLKELQQKQQRRHNVNSSSVVDATAAKAGAEVDDIAAFLDNITQELESIDAIESQRERDLSAAVGYRR